MTLWRSHNQLTLLRSGAEYFPALLAALHAARQEIYLESYLFHSDATGKQVIAALADAARRSVQVQVLLDGFGAHDLPHDVRQQLRHAGVALLFYRPELSRFSLKRSRLRRMHRKLVSIDGKIGFIGGINILDDIDADGLPPRYDYALQVIGPVAADIRQAAVRLWRRTARRQLKWRWVQRVQAAPPVEDKAGHSRAALVIRDNLRHRRDIEAAYLEAMRGAKTEIIIANAYFLPGITMRHALLDAARRGVRVTLLLQGRVEYLLIHYASRVLYRPLLQAGVEIHEYTAGLMHAKVAVIDQQWFTVGSSNIDPFSLLTAHEANIVARHAAPAQLLRADLLHHLKTCATRIDITNVQKHGWQQVLPWMAYQLVRILLGLTGYGRNEYRE